eukprot:gene8638-9570_t
MNTALTGDEAAGLLKFSSGQLGRINAGLGIFSRSKIVASLSRALRGEDIGSVREGLQQAIVTLAVLDVGGGVLAPYASNLIEDVTTKPIFQKTDSSIAKQSLSLATHPQTIKPQLKHAPKKIS